jgi:uncharacterized protein (DUF2235 family)
MKTTQEQNDSETSAHPQTSELKSGRNIILLSDGTGNSAAKLNKTNVWRLYQALELNDGTQLAFYDNGVGTSGFKPLQILGGAIGLGLARNVRDLYSSLCQHYRAPDDSHAGDRIYVFGFSRGAFTARILVDLITSCGILDPSKSIPASNSSTSQLPLNTEQGLKQGVKLAYKAYRRKYAAPFFARVYRMLRDKLRGPIPDVQTFRQCYSYALDEPIEAVGVWDTVAAYGMPIEEISDFVDKLFFKLRFEEQNLNPKVGRAYHALAIDDERHSFRPLLWNEKGEEDPERIQQVWFAGMHSDVGGGYSNGGLSLHSLNWMVNALKRKSGEIGGLVFSDNALEQIQRSAATTAPMHDARSGLSIYYRYKPRIVDDLVNDRKQNVYIDIPKIHESVLERIAQDTEGYSPPGLPLAYEVIDDKGNPISSHNYESDSNLENRTLSQNRARRHIFWRRVNYFVMVVTTLALFLMPIYRHPTPGLETSGFQSIVGNILSAVAIVLPSFVSKWTDAWTQSPFLFTSLTLFLTGLILYARGVAQFIHLLGEAGWWPVKNHPGQRPVLPEKGFFERLADKAFANSLVTGFLRLVNRSLMWIILVLVVLLLMGNIY